MYKNLIIKFIFVYFLLISIATILFTYDYNETKEKYLNQKTKQHTLEYKAIYNEHKVISNLIFDTDINTDKIINLYKNAYKATDLEKNIIREKLLKILDSKYKKLKNYNLRQLHFHLPDNRSFLRMHRPKKFGDDLTNIRETVKYVNENKKYFHGFEEGRIFNGFRFVYPLFSDKNEHIGSVEISFSVLALIQSIYKTYNLRSNFLIRKDIVDKKVFEEERKNYILSSNKDFYFEKSVYEAYPPMKHNTDVKDLSKRILVGKPFSVYIKKSNIIKTILPIKNSITKEVVAVLCICAKDNYLTNTKNNLLLTLTITYLFLAIILYLFFIQKESNIKLHKLNKDLDKRIDLEIRKSRRKDISILNHAKMASLGDMLNNIAHQWRQPLNVISTSASGLKIHKEVNTLDDNNFKLLTDSITEQATYLSKTIENFREYLHDNNDVKKRFTIQSKLDNALNIVEDNFKYNHINIIKKYNMENLYITANSSDMIQVILHILNNAKDALIKNNNENSRNITIEIKEKPNKIGVITIEDNAGGIPEKIIEKIFDPYFTTKHEYIGTGISLYMCYEIVTINLKGKIYVKNKKNGAKFYIELPLII